MYVTVKHNIVPLQVDFLFPIARKVLGHVIHYSLLNVICTDLMRMVKASPVTVTSRYYSSVCQCDCVFHNAIERVQTSQTGSSISILSSNSE